MQARNTWAQAHGLNQHIACIRVNFPVGWNATAVLRGTAKMRRDRLMRMFGAFHPCCC